MAIIIGCFSFPFWLAAPRTARALTDLAMRRDCQQLVLCNSSDESCLKLRYLTNELKKVKACFLPRWTLLFQSSNLRIRVFSTEKLLFRLAFYSLSLSLSPSVLPPPPPSGSLSLSVFFFLPLRVTLPYQKPKKLPRVPGPPDRVV